MNKGILYFALIISLCGLLSSCMTSKATYSQYNSYGKRGILYEGIKLEEKVTPIGYVAPPLVLGVVCGAAGEGLAGVGVGMGLLIDVVGLFVKKEDILRNNYNNDENARRWFSKIQKKNRILKSYEVVAFNSKSRKALVIPLGSRSEYPDLSGSGIDYNIPSLNREKLTDSEATLIQAGLILVTGKIVIDGFQKFVRENKSSCFEYLTKTENGQEKLLFKCLKNDTTIPFYKDRSTNKYYVNIKNQFEDLSELEATLMKQSGCNCN